MEQGKVNHEFEEETTVVTGEKNEIKSPCGANTQPSKDLNRYLVDKFHLPTAKTKSAPFESIDLSMYKASAKYKPSAKCLSFSTSQDRLLLWITAFQYRYYEITGNAADYKVIWEQVNTSTILVKSN